MPNAEVVERESKAGKELIRTMVTVVAGSESAQCYVLTLLNHGVLCVSTRAGLDTEAYFSDFQVFFILLLARKALIIELLEGKEGGRREESLKSSVFQGPGEFRTIKTPQSLYMKQLPALPLCSASTSLELRLSVFWAINILLTRPEELSLAPDC